MTQHDFLHQWAAIAQHIKNIEYKESVMQELISQDKPEDRLLVMEIMEKNKKEFAVIQKKMDAIVQYMGYGKPQPEWFI